MSWQRHCISCNYFTIKASPVKRSAEEENVDLISNMQQVMAYPVFNNKNYIIESNVDINEGLRWSMQ